MTTKPKTCGECKHWNSVHRRANLGSCSAECPRWVWVSLESCSPNACHGNDTQADVCDCFQPKESSKP